MHKEVEDYIKLQRKLFVLKYATLFKTKKEAYLACGVPKSTFYDWKKAYDEAGEEGLTIHGMDTIVKVSGFWENWEYRKTEELIHKERNAYKKF